MLTIPTITVITTLTTPTTIITIITGTTGISAQFFQHCIAVATNDCGASDFESELILQMSLALESVCETLELSFTADPATRLVASKIIELAQRGVQDAPTLSAMTLKEFKDY